ncbi:MAG: D-Ala-D-Ala carboxypeptidase family metallohydrolase [Alistipes sp.]|nr:D-Ala-D-Ala carboxypeptidase family metallohydrolase [Alistipes sp.]
MIKTYKFSDNTQLTPHFNAKEFRCKCGKEHNFQISEELVDKLEKLYSALDCSKIIVTSGYRCAEHDKTVGGSGTGQHTKGTAADICCYGQDGQPISSKTICCTAQDIGFIGIANIDSKYIYTHVDVRTGSKWYGDETKGNGSVTSDFYSYFGIQKGGVSTMKGIDVSAHNGNIDWQKVKSSGIDFAILRAGYGKLVSQKDKQFENNYSGAKAAGVPVGAYWYSYATTPDEARLEAEVCISILKGKQFEFPIFFDQEEKATLDTGKANCSAMIRAFCDVLEAAGYWVGLYTSRSALSTHIEDDIKTRYALWVAEWGSKLNYSGSVGIWQYSGKGSVNGISGDVDLDTAYVDYPAKVKAAGLNGYSNVSASDTMIDHTDKESSSVSVTVKIGNDSYNGTLTKV